MNISVNTNKSHLFTIHDNDIVPAIGDIIDYKMKQYKVIKRILSYDEFGSLDQIYITVTLNK